MANRIAISIVLVVVIVSTMKAGIIKVIEDGSGDYTTIQEAINAAVWNSGDTVLVYPGEYYENINYNGKHITIASLYIIIPSVGYIYNTIINGGQLGSCVTMNGGQSAMTINGFTIRNGLGYNAGGIYIYYATGVVKNCIIEKNIGTGIQYGGGISIRNGSGTVMNCTIENNTGYNGGGIMIWYSQLSISGTTIKYNHAYGPGGGIYCGHQSGVNFDPVNKCNIYLNYGSPGTDFYKFYSVPNQSIKVDTFTVMNPDQYFIGSYDGYGNPTNNVSIQLDHAHLEPVNHDLYINPVLGDDSNSGLSINDPLKTIAYAFILISADSVNPRNIYLSNGIYSPSTNKEKLPFGTKSYVSLIGQSTDSTIIDADSLSPFIIGMGIKKSISIKNITFQNCTRGIILRQTDSVLISDVIMKNGGGYTNFTLGNIHSLVIRNTQVKNFRGDYALSINNWGEQQNYFSIENCLIENNSYDNSYPAWQGKEGGGIEIAGSWGDTTFRSYGRIINSQITKNTRMIDPEGSDGNTAGLFVNGAVKVDLINATIGNNIVVNTVGSGVSSAMNAELNIYNSILFENYQKELALGHPDDSRPATCRVYSSNLGGGKANIIFWHPLVNLVWGTGNIDADPLWDLSAATPYAVPWNSPCVNAGTPMFEFGMSPPYIIQEDTVYKLITFDYDTIALPATDLAGNPRFMEGRIDIGAFENQDITTGNTNPNYQMMELEIDVFPNPFYTNTNISFDLQEKAKVQAIIYDLSGIKVKKLLDAIILAGKYNLLWAGDDYSGQQIVKGTYLVSLYVNGDKIATEKIIKKR